ncbi:MAG TPA: FIST N-terminal domain-containing protein, partial [Planktothrix sp.]
MRWGSAVTYDGERRYGSARQYIADLVEKVQFQLSGDVPDLAIAFVSPHFLSEYEHIPELLQASLGAKHFIGCSAGGLIGGGLEVEQQKALALTAAVLPGVDIKTFHLDDSDMPDQDAPQPNWYEWVGVNDASEPNFILLPDAFSFAIDAFVEGLDFAFPKAVKLGGLASGGNRPGLNALFCEDRLYRTGIVGAAISGNVIVDPVVAQGCRPIGKPLRVTKCENNFLIELDGLPAVHALKDVLVSLSAEDQAAANNSLCLGMVMNEFKDDFKVGDFLIRNIIGIEPRSGALMIGELPQVARTVQFHLRDAATSSDDLRMSLKRYSDERGGPGDEQSQGALLFQCLGRGRHLYGRANHDTECFRQYLGEVPLGGFFCSGEIGPVGGTTFLHGYTSSFGIFR